MSVDSTLTRFNPLVARILGSRLHWLLGRGLMLLSYRGRRSGRRITIPVGYQRDGDHLTVLVSEAARKQWWRNFAEAREVEVRLRGRVRSGRGRLVAPTSTSFREAVERTLRRVPAMGRVLRVDFDRRRGLQPDQIERLGREVAVVRIDLEPGPAG